MAIFTQQDLDFFDHNGYVIARNILPKENLEAVIAALWAFLGMDPNNPEDWYREPHSKGGMIELYQHQALWNNRQHPNIHQAFSEIFGTPNLWVSEDRVSMKPPQNPKHPEYDHKGFTHWDIDTTKFPLPFGVQGVVSLTDTTENMGGFQCIPGFHLSNLERWIASQPADRHPMVPDLNALPPGMKVTPIPSKAGDLIIWNTRLAHGNGHNTSNMPRLAQYITMFPVPKDEAVREEQRKSRINRWEKRLAGLRPGDARRWEELHGTTAELDTLGRKLLGVEAW